MSHDYVEYKRSLEDLFGLGVLGKIKFLSTVSHRKSSGFSLWEGNWMSKLPVVVIGNLPIWCRTKKEVPDPKRKFSRKVGGKGRKMGGPDLPPGCSASKLGWNRAKSYNHMHGAKSCG
ncbi:hypothetical protein TNCV_3939111 [Trichonephila clavipes]|nr:hypothetical protein TNCV_3939111 [Trichonephila clavipes]